MKLNKLETCERTKLERFLNKVQLPNIYRSIGLVVVVLSFIGLTIIKFTQVSPEWRPVLRQVMLVGLLVISLSREKIEDELIETLRSKSYALAFIIGVVYTMLQPLVNYVVDFVLGEREVPKDIGYVQVLLFMLLIQVMFFELLKRNR
ncbi:hypothetical protein OE09_1946 [Flavobacteriaceae bacterium MAR_2010_72]|nr:hypothetical protein OE09_1946 [Flavobacteriaceae bacterium MAR_2010_72]TVZ59344.1 hypothetical protein NA63_1872 [Flavobacteriaceae bacterium MAR_2010_105]